MGISFSEVNFKYKDNYVLKEINVDIPPSKLNIFLGPSGSGKSTLLKLINGLLKPSEGKVIVNNYTNSPQINKKSLKLLLNNVGYVFQNPEDQFFAETVEEELFYGPNNKGIPKNITKNNIEYYFRLFNLNLDYLKKSPRKLSGGEMRKIAIIITLLMEQDIILLDEPTAGLDIESKYNIFHLLKKINYDTNKTIIVTTHEIDLALKMADYLYLMENGKIIDNGLPADVFSNRNSINNMSDFFQTPYLELINELEYYFNVKIPLFKKNVEELIHTVLKG